MFRPLAVLLLAAGVFPLAAQDRAPAGPAKPSVEKLDETRYRLGGITFDRKSREIRFPAKVNMAEGLLEFLVVHRNGKVHESLLVTEISPTHLNLVLTLLRYPPSRELYALPNGTGGQSGDFPEVSPEVRAASRIAIHAEWKDRGKTRRIPVNEWIQHATKLTDMPAGPWVYGGSEFYDGKYVPESTGDIAAIFVTHSALINYPGEDHWDDTVWLAFPERVPEVGTNLTVIIAPYSETPTPPKS